MAKQHWLVKQEPEEYAWDQFVADGRTAWTGVRNYQARNHLRAMQVGDAVLFYASVSTKAVLGTARVVRGAFPDPTVEPDEKGDWVAVELAAGRGFARPVTLAAIKGEPGLAQIPLLRQSRLSVLPLTAAEFDRIVTLGG